MGTGSFRGKGGDRLFLPKVLHSFHRSNRGSPLALYDYGLSTTHLNVSVILGPEDTAIPYEVMSALDAIHDHLLTRYAGSSMGQTPGPLDWQHATETQKDYANSVVENMV